MTEDTTRAKKLLREAAADGLIHDTEPRHQPQMVGRIASALTERAAEELRAAADDLERPRKGWRGLADALNHSDTERAGYAHWLRERAERLEALLRADHGITS